MWFGGEEEKWCQMRAAPSHSFHTKGTLHSYLSRQKPCIFSQQKISSTQYPPIIVTALLAYPNEYTRMGAPKLIYLLFSQCGITNQEGLCDYTNRNFTNANDDVTIAEAGPGVYTAMWQLSLALVFKLLVTIFTFGIKGTQLSEL